MLTVLIMRWVQELLWSQKTCCLDQVELIVLAVGAILNFILHFKCASSTQSLAYPPNHRFCLTTFLKACSKGRDCKICIKVTCTCTALGQC